MKRNAAPFSTNLGTHPKICRVGTQVVSNAKEFRQLTRTYRRRWLVLHRFFGLALGFIVAIVGLTGAITVYEEEFEAFLDPALHYVEPGPELASFENILDAALAAYPDRWLVSLRPNDGHPRMAYWLTLRKDGESDIRVSVNPYTAEVLGARSNWTLPTIIRRLHVALLMGEIGTYLLGLASIGLMAPESTR